MEEVYLTVKEVSAHYKIAVQTLYNYVSKKKIPYHKFGNNLRFKTSELDKWMLNVPAISLRKC